MSIILFILVFIIVFIIHKIIMRKYLKNKKDIDKYPTEALILKNMFKVDIDSIDKKKLLNTISIVSSIDISLIVSIVTIFDKGYIEILLSLVIVIPIILCSYYLLSKYYNK